MPNTAPDSRLHVVVGVLRDGERLLIQQRITGQVCAGQWEFPGGKVEAGESPRDALTREISEELGVTILRAQPLLNLPFDYPHARVWLEVFLVDAFDGEVTGREGQPTEWLTPTEIRQRDILAAVLPILDVLESELAK